MKIRVADKILYNSLVNGEGVRAVIFFAGCKRNCRGCRNVELQDFNAGIDREIDDIVDEVLENIEMIDGVTISGGDPIYQYYGLFELCKKLKEHNINIWLYTGEYVRDLAEMPEGGIIKMVDAIVDGPYLEELNKEGLKYKGSSNQNIWKCIRGSNGTFILQKE